MESISRLVSQLQSAGVYNGPAAYREAMDFEKELLSNKLLNSAGSKQALALMQSADYRQAKDACTPDDDHSIGALTFFLVFMIVTFNIEQGGGEAS